MGSFQRLDWAVNVSVMACAAVMVVVLSEKGGARRGAAFFLGWMVPGAGHVFLGKWKKGLFFFALLAATYLFGLWIAGFRAVAFDDNPFYYVGQYGSGTTLLLARVMAAERAFPRPGIHPSWFDPGLLYVCVAGLLNLVVAMNVLDVDPKGAPAAAAPGPVASEKSA